MNICQQRLSTAVDHWAKLIQQALWPSTCVLCGQQGRPGQDLCAGCEADLPRNAPACGVCALPLAGTSTVRQVCGACLRRPPRFDRSHVPFRYAYPMADLVQSLKYRGRLPCGRVLGELLARHIVATRDRDLPRCIVPVPLAARRYRERGYNQAIELGLQLEKSLGVKMQTDIAVRVRDTREQAELDQKGRRRNVAGAFDVLGPLPAQHVAILDDVVTTGSTVNELAKMLRRAGAARIELWAVARAVRNPQ